MTGSTVNGSGNGARSGAQTLSLLADPLNVAVLHSLSAGPKRQLELRRESGSPAQSTLRAHLRSLEGIGAITRQRRNTFPGSLEHELEKPGEELLFVAATLSAGSKTPQTIRSSSALTQPRRRSGRWSTAGRRRSCARLLPARSPSPI